LTEKGFLRLLNCTISLFQKSDFILKSFGFYMLQNTSLAEGISIFISLEKSGKSSLYGFILL